MLFNGEGNLAAKVGTVLVAVVGKLGLGLEEDSLELVLEEDDPEVAAAVGRHLGPDLEEELLGVGNLVLGPEVGKQEVGPGAATEEGMLRGLNLEVATGEDKHLGPGPEEVLPEVGSLELNPGEDTEEGLLEEDNQEVSPEVAAVVGKPGLGLEEGSQELDPVEDTEEDMQELGLEGDVRMAAEEVGHMAAEVAVHRAAEEVGHKAAGVARHMRLVVQLGLVEQLELAFAQLLLPWPMLPSSVVATSVPSSCCFVASFSTAKPSFAATRRLVVPTASLASPFPWCSHRAMRSSTP